MKDAAPAAKTDPAPVAPGKTTKPPAPEKAVPTEWPAPPMPRLVALLAALQEANKAQKNVIPVLQEYFPGIDENKDLTLPVDAEARIIELRSGTQLHGAFVLPCRKGAQMCETDCDQGLAIKQAGSELVLAPISAELFAGEQHRFDFSPDFPATSVLLVQYTIQSRIPCSQDFGGEYTDKVERAHLFKIGDRRIVSYEKFTEGYDSSDPGHHEAVSTSFSWHQGSDGTWYLAIGSSEEESFSDTDPDGPANRRTTCRTSRSVLVMAPKKTWKQLKGDALERLQKQEPVLQGFPKYDPCQK
ncbi:MAG: hypothetical protein CVU59_07650 [Deltaproteobacteria bacterium HGW-Deltaproteobacteria-17]|nr:MAG: hypothetical protein CVU59_07650 [Deltaproteobacteria bacterium HGW-Deltaproteobacteria-17]